MGTCEPGQGRNPAAISSQPFVRWVSHRTPSASEVQRSGFEVQGLSNHGLSMNPEPGTLNPEPPAAEAAGEYVVVARRYRPQTFDELVGQQHVAQALAGAIQTNRVGHAYLFTGARGVGKTSAARIFAKALDCVTGPTAKPCNECDVCLGITAGDDVDVIEIDGASNRGIDDIRQLRQNANVRPSRARFKVYIIDEVHMLTRESFNALLKTLEEPPEHVKFIFCTTEPEKIPITILSRCQRFDFAGIETMTIAERLRQIIEAEGVSVDPEAIDLLARRAAGSMRDSQSLLEQILASGGKSISIDDVQRLLGIAADTRLAALVGHLIQRNAAGALVELDAAVQQGVDVGQMLDQLLGWLRDLLVASVGCPTGAMLYVAPSRMQEIAEWGPKIGVHTLLAMLQIVEQAATRLKQTTHGRTVAELALVRVCCLDELDDLAAALDRLGTAGSSASAGPASSGSGSSSLARPALNAPSSRPAAAPFSKPPTSDSDALKKNAEAEVARNGETSSRSSNSQPSAAPPRPAADPPARAATNAPVASSATGSATSTPIVLSPQQARALWNQAITQFHDLLADQAAMVERVTSPTANRLVAAFSKKYNLPKSFCERPDQIARLEQALSAAAGGPMKVEFVLLDEPVGDARPVVPKGPTEQEKRREKMQLPFVRKATELFDARLVKVEDAE